MVFSHKKDTAYSDVLFITNSYLTNLCWKLDYFPILSHVLPTYNNWIIPAVPLQVHGRFLNLQTKKRDPIKESLEISSIVYSLC